MLGNGRSAQRYWQDGRQPNPFYADQVVKLVMWVTFQRTRKVTTDVQIKRNVFHEVRERWTDYGGKNPTFCER